MNLSHHSRKKRHRGIILPVVLVILFLGAGLSGAPGTGSSDSTPALFIPAAEDSTRLMLGAVQELQIQAVRCSFDTILSNVAGVPVTVDLANRCDAAIEIQLISIYFTYFTQGDRNADYTVTAVPPASSLIAPGESESFNFLVDVLDGALANEIITIEALAFGIRQDNLEQVTAGSFDSRTVLDEFEVADWGNNDGDTDWVGPWVEIGESDGPDSGLVFVTDVPVTPDSVLAIGAKEEYTSIGIRRDADLSGATEATLELNWKRAPSYPFTGTILIQVSEDGGSSWIDMKAIEGGTGFISVDESFDITPYISSRTAIRLMTDGTCSGYIYLNDIRIVFKTPGGIDRWVVVERGLIAKLALFDTRGTAGRSDDSLIVMLDNETILLNTVSTASGGMVLCDIPYELQSTYRLVLQYHSIDEWEWQPEETGKGYFAFNNSTHGFGRVGIDLPGTREFLLTTGMLDDDEDDPVDCLIGATEDNTPRWEWDLITDPFTGDPNIDTGKLGEYGALIEGLDPPRRILDCVDGGKNWKITGKCEPDRSYFHELWFVPDNEWEHGDTADIYLHIDGKDPEPDLSEFHVLFRMIDEDVCGPVIGDFSPEIVQAGTDIFISCLITDERGVYDDGTGSEGNGVYLLWDTDGELISDSHEIQMDSTGGGYYRTLTSLGTFTEGTEIIYAVHACDNDDDTGPEDRSCSWSSVRTIDILGVVTVFDSPGSLYPSSVYPAEDAVGFQIDLSNPNAEAIAFDRNLSYMVVDDGSLILSAPLANNTILLAGASDYTVVFEEMDIPSGINAPDTIWILVHLEGLYMGTEAWTQEWRLSVANRLVVEEPVIKINAHSLPSLPVRPGAKTVELLRLEFTNEGMEDAFIDSMIVLNTSSGYLGSAGIDDVFDGLYLYKQGTYLEATLPESHSIEEQPLLTRPFSDGDSLAATAEFEDGRAVFVLPAAGTLPAWESVFYYVMADLDSFLASDGDLLDLAVSSPDSIFIRRETPVRSTSLSLDSEGTTQVDGCLSYQMLLEDASSDTLWSGMDRQVVMTAKLPSNGRSPDVLSAMAVMNYGDPGVDNIFEKVEFWRDDGDGVFSPGDDILIGLPVYTGDRFEISGLKLPILGQAAVFVTVDAGQEFTGDITVSFGIPVNGIQYVSGNDGPIDMDVVQRNSQLLVRREYVEISVPSSVEFPEFVSPGERDAILMAVQVENHTLSNLDLENLVVRRGGSPAGCVPPELMNMYLDDGDFDFDPDDDEYIASATWRPDGYEFEVTSLSVVTGESAILYFSADMDSILTPDGDTLNFSIESVSDIVFSPITGDSYDIDGDFPLALHDPPVTDGMMAHQLNLSSIQDSTIAERLTDILAMDIRLPGNGCLADTLASISLVNSGTAREGHIQRVVFWKDDGDGLFSAASDTQAGVFSTVDNVDFALAALSIPLAGDLDNRFFITVDLVEGFTTGANILFMVPIAGVEVVSGNDGPVDRAVMMNKPIVIPVPDRITVYASLMGNKRVNAGQKNVLNMVLGAYNSYSGTRLLESLTLLKGGSSRAGEIETISAWSDADRNGLFDPGSDELLASVVPEDVLVRFSDLGMSLDPYRSSLLFITYDLPGAGVRDSVSIDFSIPEYKYIGFADANTRIEGQFPLESAGIDMTDGMTAAQLGVTRIEDVRAVPGEDGIPCCTVTISCNGTDEDMLTGFSVDNAGNALVGMDIDYMRLWRETGGEPGRFDEGAEDFLGYLVWNGTQWSDISPLGETIPCGGLTLHVTADLAASATGGRTLSIFVPVNGIRVESGNDGPVDAPSPSSNTVTVTADPLLLSYECPFTVTAGQSFYLNLNVMNATDTTIRAVSPDSFAWTGDGEIGLLSGPEPPAMDMESGKSAVFRWSLEAVTTGKVVFGAIAANTPRTAVSSREYSDTLCVEKIPAGVSVTLDDLTPVNLNRGSSDVAAVEMIASYGGSCSGCAGVDMEQIRIRFVDSEGLPVPVGEIAGEVTLEDEERVLAAVDASGITESYMTMIPDQPIYIVPGNIKTLKISIDVNPVATVSGFRIVIESASWILIEDHNSGEPVEFAGIDYPWTTNTVTLKDPAVELLISMDGRLPDTVNRGQENVPAFTMTMINSGAVSGADISVSRIELAASGEGGVSQDPGDLIMKLVLKDQAGYTVFTTGDFGGSDEIACDFNPGLIVSSTIPIVLVGSIDASYEPESSSMCFSLEDSLGISARDINSGVSIAVRPDTGAGYSFPMVTGTAGFMDALSGVFAAATGSLPASVTVADEGVAVFDITVTHTGQPGESPAELSSITLRLLDNIGNGMDGNTVVKKLTVMAGDSMAGSFFPSAGNTSSYLTVPFANRLDINAEGSLMLSVILDMYEGASTGLFQFQIAANGIEVYDGTSGERFTNIGGDFPLASGVSEIVLPADRITINAESVMPHNASTRHEIGIFDISFSRGAGEGGSVVKVDAVTVELLNLNGTSLDASSIVESARLECGGVDISGFADMAEDGIKITLSGAPGVEPGSSLTMRLYCTLFGTGGERGMSARIASAGAVQCHDSVSGMPVDVFPREGTLFPFNSETATLIPGEIEASFSNFPNPFTPSESETRVVFYMPKRGRVALEIYTVLGRLVRRLIEGVWMEAGLHQDIRWDGKNGDGDKVLSGVYYLVLKIDDGGGEKEYRRKAAVLR